MSLHPVAHASMTSAYRYSTITASDQSARPELGRRPVAATSSPAATDRTREVTAVRLGRLRAALRTAEDGVHVARTAAAALSETSDVLRRMRALATLVGDGGPVDARTQLSDALELTELQAELDRIAHDAAYGWCRLLDGSYRGTFQVGVDGRAQDRLFLDLSAAALAAGGRTDGSRITGLDATGLGVGIESALSGWDGPAAVAAPRALAALDRATTGVWALRARLEAVQERFEGATAALRVQVGALGPVPARLIDESDALDAAGDAAADVAVQAAAAVRAHPGLSAATALRLLG